MSELSSSAATHPSVKLILTLMVVVLGFVVVGPLVGYFLAMPFMEGSITDQLKQLADPIHSPAMRVPLYIMQGSATLIGLAVLPSLYWYASEHQGVGSWFSGKKIYLQMLPVVVVIAVAFTVADSVFIDWNAHVQFPEFLKGFETWARDYEDRAEALTKYLTAFSSPGYFLLAFFVVAILPGFCEELVFRGLIQTQLVKMTKNAHVAIWLSAILFSAFHLQFFGFVPRMLLGALFGYLYYWSGNLFMSMFAHFFNNGLMVVMLYLNQRGLSDVDVDTTEAAPWPVVIGCMVLGAGLLYYYKRFYQQQKEAHGNE